MRLGLYQGPQQPGSVADNLCQLADVAAAAGRGGARLLACPEMFLTGYNIGPMAVDRLAEPADGPAAQQVAEIAADAGLAILYGYPERADGGVYNSVQLLDRDGSRLVGYRKTHLFSDLDRAAFRPGDTHAPVIGLEDLRIGVLICYDVEFPEMVRAHALAGADLVVVPTALMRPYEVVARTVVPARAYENQVFLAYVNRCGAEEDLEYCGLSCAVAPDGNDLARAGVREELLLADIDPAALRSSRKVNTHLDDRRPLLYGPLSHPASDPAALEGGPS